MPGVSQRRRFIDVASPASLPVELAVEDGNRPEAALAEPRRELLGDDDRAVVAAGATDGDRQPRLALGDVGRDGEVEKAVEGVEELARDRLVEDVLADRVGQPRQ